MSVSSAPASELEAGEAARPASDFRRRGLSPGTRGRWAAYALLALIAAFCVVPFVWPLLAAVDARAELFLRAPDLSSENFRKVLGDADYRRLALNSTIIAVSATAIVLVTSTLGGYALSRFAFRGRRALMFGVLFIRMVPPAVTIVPLYIIMRDFRLSDTYLGVILAISAQQLPLALWLMKGFFDTVPRELEEAGWLDGLGRLGSAFRIVLPLAAPGVGATALFTFIEAWGDFLTPLVLLAGAPDKVPLSIGIFKAFVRFNIVDWGVLSVVAILYTLPAVVLYLGVRKYMLRATLTGGLEGT